MTSGFEIRTEKAAVGTYVTNLKDDVNDLSTFKFQLPGVPLPDLYDVFLEMGDKEVFIGKFSYNMNEGRSIDLPNYPPMKIGCAATKDKFMFVGVKSGMDPEDDNRFLMKSGFEIYNIGIWERPIRLAQRRLDSARSHDSQPLQPDRHASKAQTPWRSRSPRLGRGCPQPR